MENLIIKKKLLLAHHLEHLGENTLGKAVLEEQKKLEFPGLWNEEMGYMSEMEISVKEIQTMTKFQWKKRFRGAILERNRKNLLCQIEEYKKINVMEISSKNFETKSYFSELTLDQARTKFAIDTKMLRTVKSHFPSDKKNEDDLCRQYPAS